MNQVTKNLALSAPLMTYLHAVVVRLKLFSSPIQFLPQESIVGRAAVCRPQAAEFSLLHLCRGSRAGPGCAASLPTGSPGGYLLTLLFIHPCSETESGECSEGEMSDLTPCNASPSLSQLLSWTGCRCYNTQCSKMKAPRKLDSHDLQAFGEE